MNKNANKGFASMSPEKRREIARKGGQKISANKEFMSMIGRKGGSAPKKKVIDEPAQSEAEQSIAEQPAK